MDGRVTLRQRDRVIPQSLGLSGKELTAVSRSSSSYLPALVTTDARLACVFCTRGAKREVAGKAVRAAIADERMRARYPIHKIANWRSRSIGSRNEHFTFGNISILLILDNLRISSQLKTCFLHDGEQRAGITFLDRLTGIDFPMRYYCGTRNLPT